MMLKALIFCLMGVFFMCASAMAVPTEIVVKVKSKDGKFIGSSMGGVLITLKDAHTGELLAKSVTKGGTGDTDLIMKTPS